MKRRIKVHGFLIFVSVVFIILFPRLFFRNQKNFKLEFFAEALGIFLVLLGQVLRVSARGFKAEHSGQGSLLITDGPYSLVRNPMYLGVFLIGLGVSITLFQAWVAAIFLLFFYLYYVRLMAKEERRLSEGFGKNYLNYSSRTPRIFPRWQALFKKRALPLKIKWFKKEIVPMVLLLVFIFVLKFWKERWLFK